MARFAAILALFLTGVSPCGASYPPDRVRTIPVTIATDASFRQVDSWRGVARRAVERGSEGLMGSLGIRFDVVEETTWEPARSLDGLEEALDAATRAIGPLRTGGILVVLTGDRFYKQMSRPEVGYSFLGQPAMILVAANSPAARRNRDRTDHLAWLFRHELGHVLGVPHLSFGDIMATHAEAQRWHYGEIALDVMRANRLMVFSSRSPFSGCDLGTLRDAYFLLDERGEIDTASLVNLGAALHREGRAAEAAEAFDRAVKRDDSTAALLGLAQSRIAAGDTAGARVLVEEASGRDLTAEELGVAGGVWLRLGAFRRAEETLSEALDALPERFSTLFNRGLARFHQESFGEAKADFERALAVEERPEGWFNLGLACDALEDRDCRERAFGRYLELVPEGPRAEEARRFLAR